MTTASFDVLIRGGLVVDGSGADGSRADVGVRGDRIDAVGDLAGSGAALVIDATDRVVAPGFIDTHGHSDFALALRPEADSKLLQGVTTEVVGNCGGSAFPISPAFGSLHFVPATDELPWKDVRGYFTTLGSAAPSINVAALVGHSAVRAAVLGMSERAPTADELERMRAIVRDALAAGCVGLSFGGHFAPSLYAATEELVALAAELGSRDAIFAAHLRDYGARSRSALEEVGEVARQAGARLHISLLHAHGRPNWGRVNDALRYIERLPSTGVDVTLDSLAYPTVGAWWAPRAVLPPEVYDWRSGGLEGAARLAREVVTRKSLGTAIEDRRRSAKAGFDQEYLVFSDWRDIHVRERSNAGGDAWRTVTEIAGSSGRSEVDTFLDLLAQEGGRLVSLHVPISCRDHEAVLRHALCSLGTDGIAARLGHPPTALDRLQQHPRHWDTFARLLGHYVRDRGLLSLSEAVRKITTLPARAFRLADRGAIEVGYFADLVVFDPRSIGSAGDWTEPSRPPTGIDAVLVNGRIAAQDGAPTAVRAGRVLRA